MTDNSNNIDYLDQGKDNSSLYYNEDEDDKIQQLLQKSNALMSDRRQTTGSEQIYNQQENSLLM
jgi:hypothetical protein